MRQPALLGGLFIGVLSALPVVNVVNCCCLWIVAGGALSAHLLQQERDAPVTAGDGALVGFLAGVAGAVVWLMVSIPLQLVIGPLQAQLFERAIDSARDLPPDARDWLDSLAPAGVVGISTVVGFVVMLVTGGIFATLGGVLGAMVVRKDAPPPPPPSPFDVSPPVVPPAPPPAEPGA